MLFATRLHKNVANFAAIKLEMMKKSYKIAVDCANCANLIEHAISGIEGVKQTHVSFITQRMRIEFDEEADTAAVVGEIVKRGRGIEPGFDVL